MRSGAGYADLDANAAGLAAVCRSLVVFRFHRGLLGADLAVERKLVAVFPLGIGAAPIQSERVETAVEEAALAPFAVRVEVTAVREASGVEAGACVARSVRDQWCAQRKAHNPAPRKLSSQSVRGDPSGESTGIAERRCLR